MAVVGLSSACAQYDIKKNHPHFLDTTRGYARVYQAKPVTPTKCGDPNYFFEYTGVNKPISEMNGYICIPASEYQYNQRYYNEYLRRSQNCR